MSKFTTLHVFAYGETQIIGKGLNFKTKSSNLTTLSAFVDDVKSKRPENVEESLHHVIHVFRDSRIVFASAEKTKSFEVRWEDVNLDLLNALADELIALIPENA